MSATAATAGRSSSQASTHSASGGAERSFSGGRSKQTSLANISVRSFTDFRAQTSYIPSPRSVKRKPLPQNASPQLSCFSPTDTHFEDIEDPTSSISIDSVSSDQGSGPPTVVRPAFIDSAQEHNSKSHKHPYTQPVRKISLPVQASNGTTGHNSRRRVEELQQGGPASRPLQQPQDISGSHGGQPTMTRVLPSTTSTTMDPAANASLWPKKADMSIWPDGTLPRSGSDNSVGSTQTVSPSKQQANKFTSFFGWKSSPRTGPESPSTPFTDRSGSPPSTSPFWSKNQPLDRSVSAPRLNALRPIDVTIANDHDTYQHGAPHTPFSVKTPSVSAHFDDLEKELKEISSELAESIKREMELEDELDRCKGDSSTYPGEMTRRTSDYFSDSGSSAIKGGPSELDIRLEEAEKAKRRLEQEKASIRAEYSRKLADEMRKRHDVEVQADNLSKEMHEIQARAAAKADSKEKVRELETFLEETRRRLAQERQSRDNFEDLLAALRAELAQIRNERDNLVDEVVPGLKAQVEGMQQELGYPTPNRSRVNSIADDGHQQPSTPWAAKMGGLARSNSLFNVHNNNKRNPGTLNRSGSVKARGHESGEMKEIEDQRDALHKSLQHLIRRNEAQRREHTRAIQRLVADRDSSSKNSSRRKNFARNVATMKEEMVGLRRRVDEALTQKWQCEDSLGGVKMALDRAENETRSLRTLLGGRDPSARKGSDSLGISITDGEQDGASMVKILRRSIQIAETERDAARREAGSYRHRASSVSDHAVAERLLESAVRLEDLAAQLHESLKKNVDLRERLAAALEDGELEQNASTTKIVEMQSRLKGFEEELLIAQQETENVFAANEAVAKQTDARSTPQVTRLLLSIPASNSTSNETSEGIFSARSPRLDMTRSGKAESMGQTAKTAVLENKLADLEKALSEADSDMKRVMGRLDQSRTEVSALSGERENASQSMKELQNAISEEKQRALRLLA